MFFAYPESFFCPAAKFCGDIRTLAADNTVAQTLAGKPRRRQASQLLRTYRDCLSGVNKRFYLRNQVCAAIPATEFSRKTGRDKNFLLSVRIVFIFRIRCFHDHLYNSLSVMTGSLQFTIDERIWQGKGSI
jgi:hypothetical protein